MKVIKDNWILRLEEWLGIDRNSKDFKIIQEAVRAGETYEIKDPQGGLIGKVKLSPNSGLEICFSNALSMN